MGGREAVVGLTALAEAAGIEVRLEPFVESTSARNAPRGGLCRIRGKRIVLVDASLPPAEQAGVLGRALASVDLGGIEIPEALLSYLRVGHAEVRKLAIPRPLARGRPGRRV